MMSIFDPLGFLIPFTIQARFGFQDVCKKNMNWNSQIDDSDFLNWKNWLELIPKIATLKLERCYQLSGFQTKSAELHVFCDASQRAYEAVCYWRFYNPNNTFHIAFINSKSKIVGPKSNMTIPRLELQAALIAVRLSDLVTKEHFSKRAIFWTDSRIVLHWINKDPSPYNNFVANRLDEIRKKSRINEWKWVPSKENPADDATRYVPDSVQPNSRWFLGPSFLKKNESHWPTLDNNFQDIALSSESPDENQEENVFSLISNDFLIDFDKFLTWKRLIRHVSLIIKFVSRCQKINLSTSELYSEAELYCIKLSQLISFSDEVSNLSHGKSISNESRVLSLSPFLDSRGILCIESRLSYFTHLSLSSKPIILDAKNRLTILQIKNYHEKFFHASHETVLNELRQKFWIVGLRRALKKIVSKCTICRYLRSNPSQPRMAPLPDARLGYRMKIFYHCGMDYFGPFYVKVARRIEKRWGVIFTCMSSRAIHLEKTNSLTTSSAIMALRRFAGRRGSPSIIYCDNAKNLKGISKELLSALRKLDLSSIGAEAEKLKICWKFNPPAAPHMGGAWERLIHSVKTSLRYVLKKTATQKMKSYTLSSSK